MLKMIKDILSAPADKVATADEPKRIQLATAALFVEMAGIDGEFDATEREGILKILQDKFDLAADHAVDLLAEAETEVKESVSLWRFAKIIRDNYSKAEQQRVVDLLWQVVMLDGKLDKHEAYMMNKLQDLFHLTHDDFFEAKRKALQASKGS